MNTSFIHLKVHSEYSIIDGMVRIADLIEQAVSLKMPAVALTDHNNLFGLVKFYSKALSKGIKPIIGADVFIEFDKDIFSLTLLCKNNQGYKNLMQLISRAYLKGQHKSQVLINKEWLQELRDGLIVLSGGVRGDVGRALLSNKLKLAKQRLQYWLDLFPSHYYLELERTNRDQENLYIDSVLDLANQLYAPVVATNDVRFLQQQDFGAHEARVCIQSGYVLEDTKRPKIYSEQQYFKSTSQMKKLFADIPEAIKNSYQIAKRCNVTLSLGKVFLPRFPVASGVPIERYFRQEAEQGLSCCISRLTNCSQSLLQKYQQRLQRELNVIIEMGFSGYFLIVADFISWAKKQNIPVGPGRGSGAGSLVAYVLGITALDPLQHDLLFERFLNPERVSMPDFDIDFCMENRDRVIEYVADLYGHDAVAQIITYGTMAARAVVRDVGRVLSIPYGFVDKIAKLIPFELGMTLDKALQQEEQFADLYREDETVTNLIDLAKKLEGIKRNAGTHAGGVVIAPTKLTDFVPLYCEPNGEHVVTQFDKDDVEKIGLVKFDFLGLRTLTIINSTVRSINFKRSLKKVALIDINSLSLDDKATFNLLKSCATTAVFQLESRGMKDLIRRLQPDCFEEITALVALFRPGPLQSGMVDDFIDRKHGRAKVEYLHPRLESILCSTYGVILYQEQVMQIAQTLAGYSLGGADILRRAMGKKKPEEMALQRTVFITGACKQNINKKLANQIFNLMEKFAGYGFNKSHSAAYALISYQTAWLKTHHPAEFMAAVLSSDMDNTDKVVGFINECRRMRLVVLPPNVNTGFYHFSVNQKGEIEYGLGAIKGVGESAIKNVVKVRQNDGLYKDLFEFCSRVDGRKLTRRMLEPLIRGGAMDCFAIERSSLFASIDLALKLSVQYQHNELLGQHDLFSCDEENLLQNIAYVDALPWGDLDRLQGEKSVLGFYLSGHPLNLYKRDISAFAKLSISELQIDNKKIVVTAGIVINIRVILTRRGKKMAIVTLEDQSGKMDVTFFNDLYLKFLPILIKDNVLIVKGKVSKDTFSGSKKMIAEGVISLQKAREQLACRLKIYIEQSKDVANLLNEISCAIGEHKTGNCPVVIVYTQQDREVELGLGENWQVKPSAELIDRLNKLCGQGKVLLDYK